MKKTILIVIALLITISYSVNEAYAVNTIKQVIKIEDIYPADVASFDVPIDPPLTDLSKTFVFMSFSHTGEEDHSDSFRSWEIIDSDTLRIYGENTALGNNAQEFYAYIVEYTGDVSVQHSSRTWATSESAGEKSVVISAVTPAETMIVSKGHDHDASETTIGSEELDRIRLLTGTTWGQLIFTNPNTSPQQNLVDIVDWNDPAILVQRGILTMSSGSATATVIPATDVVRTRTMLLVTYTCGTGCGTSEASDDIMLRATLDTNPTPDIDFTRVGTEDDLQIAWELIQFPATFARVQHDSITFADTVAFATDAITAVTDFDKSIVISTVGTPFGWGGGSSSSTVDGAIDRGMVDIHLADNALVSAERGDSTGTNIVEYQVIEFLEPVFAQNPQGTNTFLQVIKVEGIFASGDTIEDYTISPALTNVDKSIIFVSMNSTNSEELGSSQFAKSWDIINPTTLRFYGSGTGAGVNIGFDFIAYIIEFDGTSPIFTQYDQLQYPEDLSDVTHTMQISTVNTTGSFIHSMGTTMENNDPTFGSEEFTRITLTSGTSWLHETNDVQDEPETVTRIMVTDFNEDEIFVQRGTGTMAGLTTSITPPIVVDREDSILIVNFMTSSGTVGEDPADTAIRSTLDGSNNIVITRNSAGSGIPFAWELITFPEDFISVQHGVQSQSAGVENNTATITAVDLTKSVVTGTVHSFFSQSLGSGSSTTVNDFDSVTGLLELEDSTTVRFVRGHDQGTWDVGYQVISFATAGGDINQGIQMQPSCCFFFLKPLIDWLDTVWTFLLINSGLMV